MSDTLELSIKRYRDKFSSSFLENWIKKNIPLPSKDKAKKFLKKTIRSESDITKLYEDMSKITSFLMSKKAAGVSVFPKGFVKNLAVLVAMISIIGNIGSQEQLKEKLIDEKIIVVKEVSNTKVQDKYMGDLLLKKDFIKKITKLKSTEEMNKVILENIKDNNKIIFKGPRKKDISNIKNPLELRITRDRGGHDTLFPSQLKEYNSDMTFFIHQEHTPDDISKIEKNIKEVQKERKH